MKKIDSIPIDKYFELIKPKYTYIEIIPHKSLRNYNSSNIVKSISYTYKSIDKRIRHEQRKFFFETNFKISYLIDITTNNVSFYFIVPAVFKDIIIEKIGEVWSQATVKEVEKIKSFSSNCDVYEVNYKKEDALSLCTDKRINEPLNSMLNVLDIMKDDDRLTVVYNFMPISQLGWQDRYESTMNKIDNKKPIERNTLSFSYVAKTILSIIASTIDGFLNILLDFTGGSSSNNESLYSSIMSIIERQQELSISTKKKKDTAVINTQIAVVSNSTDDIRKTNNAITVCQSYKALSEDNELVYKKTKQRFKIEDYDFNIGVNTCSTDETKNFVELPAYELIKNHNINCVKIEESILPDKLKEGYISLGVTSYKGIRTQAYLEDDKEIGSLPLMLLGRQGGGKTTYLCNYAKYCLKRDESIVHIDFIRNNEASKSIEKVVPKDRLMILDFSTEEGLQALSYNEVKFSEGMTWFEKQALANKKTELTIELINSINETGEPLSPKMERYLCAATDIVYLNEEATLRDVIRCLQDYRYRDEIINCIPEELKYELKDGIQSLEELDEWNKAGTEKIGTKDSKIEGILDRITLLKRDFYLKKMFNKNNSNNIDFVNAMEQGKVILVRMPQSKFKDYVKNVITTFIITKCWLAAELRGDMSDTSKRSHIIIDEISQTKTAEKYMESKLTQTRKYGIKFVLAGQYLEQLEKKTVYSLKAAGCSFMLLKGTIKEDFEYFNNELDKFDFENLKDMEKHSSLNLIQYSDGYASFITKLPKPI